jgi:NAD(P)H-nitrite reductase large subunit
MCSRLPQRSPIVSGGCPLTPKYLIIGGSAGAVGAVEAIREVDPVGTVMVVSEESPAAYSRPLIGEYLCGNSSFEKIIYRPKEFWSLNNVEVSVSKRVVSVDLSNKFVTLEGGEKVYFEKLLLATGGKPITGSIDGKDKRGVFTFTSLSDAEILKERIRGKERAVIIGGGLIGVCIAEALTTNGLDVTIVELKETILSLLLDPTSSEIVSSKIQKEGIKVLTGHSVQRIIGKNDDGNTVAAVALENGQVIPCELVVIAIGVRPRIELTQGTEVKTNIGIVVDRFMRTSVPYVYACGDAAEAYDFVYEENRILPQWPTAYSGGRTAGFNMAGKETQYPGSTLMSALKYFNIPVIAAGVTNPMNSQEIQSLISYSPKDAIYKKIVIRKGRIIGFILVKDIERAGILFYLMQKNVNTDGFREKLLSSDFGLLSLPAQIRKTLLAECLVD